MRTAGPYPGIRGFATVLGVCTSFRSRPIQHVVQRAATRRPEPGVFEPRQDVTRRARHALDDIVVQIRVRFGLCIAQHDIRIGPDLQLAAMLAPREVANRSRSRGCSSYRCAPVTYCARLTWCAPATGAKYGAVVLVQVLLVFSAEVFHANECEDCGASDVRASR
jgi:hypothetical protein